MIKCSKCGKENSEDAKFCSNCGTRLESVSKSMDDVLKTLSIAESRNNSAELADMNGEYAVIDVNAPADSEMLRRLSQGLRALEEAFRYFGIASERERMSKLHKLDDKQLFSIIKKIAIVSIIVFMISRFIFREWGGLSTWFGLFNACVAFLIVYTIEKEKAFLESAKMAEENNRKGQMVINANEQLLSILPSQYWMPTAFSNIISSLQYGRAKTIKEAMNYCDSYMIQVSNDSIKGKLDQAETEMVNQMEMTRTLLAIKH